MFDLFSENYVFSVLLLKSFFLPRNTSNMNFFCNLNCLQDPELKSQPITYIKTAVAHSMRSVHVPAQVKS